MKKFFTGLGIFGAVVFMLPAVARFTGIFQFYTIPTP